MKKLSVVLLAVAAALAQPGPEAAPKGVIAGRVFDADLDVAVEYANVILHSLRDSSQVTGGVTDAQGRFELAGVRPGRFYLDVSFIGYKPKRIGDIQLAPGARVDLGRIDIRQSVVAVEGAEVVGERPTLRYEIDKKVIDVSKLATTASGTAVDVLENAPSVKVDAEGNVSLRGSQNFTVLVDGRPTPLDGNDALQQIPAATIDRVELITNPSAKYDPEGVSGIINVVLKKQKRAGLSGVASVDGGWPERLGGSLLLSLRQERFSLFAGGDFHSGRFPGSRSSESWTTDSTGDTTFSSSVGDGARNHRFYGLRAGGDFAWSDLDRTSLSLRVGGRGFGMNQQATYRRWAGAGDTAVQTSRDSSSDGGLHLSANLDHTHTFSGRAGQQLVASFGFRRNDGSDQTANMLTDSATGEVISGRRDEETGPRQPMDYKLDYTLPLRADDKFEAGASASLHNALSRQEVWEYSPEAESFEFRPEYGLEVDYAESRPAFYAQYAGKFGSLGLQPALRVEYADRTVSHADSTWPFARWDFFPTLHASFDLPAQHQLMASYTRRIQRQRGWELWPFTTRMDAYHLRRGNPGLRPEMTDAVEAGWQRPFGASRLAIEGYYRVTHDKVERIRSVYAPGVILHTAANVGTDYALGVEAAADLELARWWKLDLAADVYDYRMKGSVGNAQFDNRSLSWEARAGLEFLLPTQTRLTASVNYESPEASAQGTDAGHLRSDAAIRQAFLNRQLVVTLQVRDLFGTGAFESTSRGDDFYNYFRFAHQSPMVSLNLVWNFNNYRPDRRQREPMDDESGGNETEGGF